MIIKNANVYKEDYQFHKEDIYIKDGVIVGKDQYTEDDILLDASGLYAIPGLTDIHFHGCVGVDFCDGNEEAIGKIAEYQAKNGITTICPATMTLEEDVLSSIMQAAAEHKNDKGADLCGINMEGPFLSHNKRGAQNEKYLVKPDIKMFHRLQEKSNDLIKLVAIAPEAEGAMGFISQLSKEVTVSIAHTEADYDTSREAFRLGARQVTHLYNAMNTFNHRAPGVIGAALDTANCMVELICDGIHIHPSMIRATFKMFGDDRIILISDSMMATGLSDGSYSLGGQQVKVQGKVATLSNGTIAGSVSNLMECLRYAVKTAGIPLESAVKCAAINSAKAIGIDKDYGSITSGKYANIVLLDQELKVVCSLVRGRRAERLNI